MRIENQDTHSNFINSLSKIVPFIIQCEKKHCRAGQARDDNITPAVCMLDA